MTGESDSARVRDEFEICKLRRIWAFARDLGEWDLLRSCFHPDATITVAWYSGPASGFVDRSIEMWDARPAEERHKHWLGNMRADIVNDRAILETDVQILIREFLRDRLFDFTGHARFYDLVERREGRWRIWKAACIYDKDRLEPVDPPGAAGVLEPPALEGRESGFAFMRLRQTLKGRTVPAGIVVGGSEDERRLRQEGQAWLSGRDAG